MDMFLKLNNVLSRIFMCGNAFRCNGSDVIVVVTGSPGVVDYYYEFARMLHNKTKLPICVVGHAGHDMVADASDNISRHVISKHQERQRLFNLAGQIEHKLDLFNNHIDKHSRLHLIGHSVGCWILLEILHRNPLLVQRVSSINLLFPVIQKISETVNGKEKQSLLFKIKLFCVRLMYFLVPNYLVKSVMNKYFKHVYSESPLFFADATFRSLLPHNLENVILMLKDEIKNVDKLNTEIIAIVKNMINVVYGKEDGWVPLRFIDDLKVFQPSIKIKEVKCAHAFTFKSNDCATIVDIVSEYIKSQSVRPLKSSK